MIDAMHSVNEESFGIIPLKRSEDQWSVFIILHKQGNHWGFPKGKADKGEDPLQSASRELHEETGLTVEKLLQNEPISETYAFFRKGEQVHKRVSYFPAIVSGALLLQTDEIRDGKWLLLSEAHKQLTFDEAKRICSKMQEILKS